MSNQFNLTIRPEPFWLQEAFACMNYVPVLDSEDWLNKTGTWNRRQKEEFLLPYRSYRGAMRSRLQKVLAQYPLLAGYTDPAPRSQEKNKSVQSPIMDFLVQMQDVLETEEMLSEENLDKELNQVFQRMLDCNPDTLSRDGEEKDLVIRSLPDVMAALEKWNGTDADKFKLLRLYSERREVMAQLWSFQGVCVEIGRECLELVRERFDAFMEELQKPGMVEEYLEKTGLQCQGSYSGQITPSVMDYNRLMIQIYRSNENPEYAEMKLHIGIELFCLDHAGAEEGCNDEKLAARLKALGDPTRLKILHQLVERPCYLQEMAKALGLTPATILHHLGLLMAEELIEIQVTSEKKKVYYQLRKRGLEEASQGILQLAMSREEREAQRKRQLQEEQQSQEGICWVIRK